MLQSMKDPLHSISDRIEISADEFPCDELFAAARTAVLVAVASTGRVVAVNLAAQRLLGLSSAQLVGDSWHKAFDSPGVRELKGAARQASALGAVAHLRVTSPGMAGTLNATLSSFFVSRTAYLLLHLESGHALGSQAFAGDPFVKLDELPIAFVITDGVLSVEFANRAFLDLTNERSRDAAAGQNLLRWLDLSPEDLGSLHRQMRMRQAATVIRARLRKEDGFGPMCEVIAVAVSDITSPHWGFVLRQSS